MHLKTLAFALFLLAPLSLPTLAAETGAPSVSVAIDGETFAALDTLTGASVPSATVSVLDATGAAAAGASVRVVFLRQVQFVGFVGNETVLATTGADGTVTVDAPQLSRAPGSYLVVAFALDAIGSDRYSVGA